VSDLVSTIPPALATAGQFQLFFPSLCEDAPASDPMALSQVLVEATAFIESSVGRRLAPFSNLTESHRLFGIDPTEYGASSDSPLDLYGSLGLSRAAAYGSGNLVRKFWVDQTAPHYADLWTYSVASISLDLTYGSQILVQPSSIEGMGPHPDTGECRLRLGTFAPEGTTIVITYGGGYTVAIPADLQRLCRYVAAKMIILDMEPQSRKEMNLDEIELQITAMLSNWAKS
jgi:hypothetical protein